MDETLQHLVDFFFVGAGIVGLAMFLNFVLDMYTLIREGRAKRNERI